MVMGVSYLTYVVTALLYQVGLVSDRGFDCVYSNNDAVPKA